MTVIKTYEEIGRGPMVGDHVRIVDNRTPGRWNYFGYMDRYLSSIMTVKSVLCPGKDFCLSMFEDEDDENADAGWAWFPEMIAGVVIDEIDEDPSVWTGEFDIEYLLTLQN